MVKLERGETGEKAGNRGPNAAGEVSLEPEYDKQNRHHCHYDNLDLPRTFRGQRAPVEVKPRQRASKYPHYRHLSTSNHSRRSQAAEQNPTEGGKDIQQRHTPSADHRFKSKAKDQLHDNDP